MRSRGPTSRTVRGARENVFISGTFLWSIGEVVSDLGRSVRGAATREIGSRSCRKRALLGGQPRDHRRDFVWKSARPGGILASTNTRCSAAIFCSMSDSIAADVTPCHGSRCRPRCSSVSCERHILARPPQKTPLESGECSRTTRFSVRTCVAMPRERRFGGCSTSPQDCRYRQPLQPRSKTFLKHAGRSLPDTRLFAWTIDSRP